MHRWTRWSSWWTRRPRSISTVPRTSGGGRSPRPPRWRGCRGWWPCGGCAGSAAAAVPVVPTELLLVDEEVEHGLERGVGRAVARLQHDGIVGMEPDPGTGGFAHPTDQAVVVGVAVRHKHGATSEMLPPAVATPEVSAPHASSVS